MTFPSSLEELLDEKPFQPTAEQQAILEAAANSRTSLMLIAMAGCSKSTTIELLARSNPPRPACYIVFGKRNQLEAVKKFSDNESPLSKFGSASHVNVVTANGLGHGAWGRAIGRRLTLNKHKLGDLVKKVLEENKIRDVDSEGFSSMMRLVSVARHAGLVPKTFPSVRGLLPDHDDSWEACADQLYVELNEEMLYVARKVLHESIRQAYQGIIDFDDQIYMSALFGGVFPRYQDVYVDEGQDLSPLNHIQVQRTAAERLFIVGDSRQAIFAFRGADSSSLDSMRSLRPEWITLPLSTTFRCPKAVVARQQAHAPGFTAHESNQEGEVIHAKDDWRIKDYINGRPLAILCRNNAPLFACALRLIKQSYGCTILGSEIGRSLVALAKKIVPEASTSAEDSIRLVEAWAAGEISKALANKKEARVEIITDKAECLTAVLENSGATTAGRAWQILSTMFSKENLQITLSTGHKAKGLEWPTVIHLDPWRIPSKFAKQAAQDGNPIPLEQDMNLKYVIETRAQERLILADLEKMQSC